MPLRRKRKAAAAAEEPLRDAAPGRLPGANERGGAAAAVPPTDAGPLAAVASRSPQAGVRGSRSTSRTLRLNIVPIDAEATVAPDAPRSTPPRPPRLPILRPKAALAPRAKSTAACRQTSEAALQADAAAPAARPGLCPAAMPLRAQPLVADAPLSSGELLQAAAAQTAATAAMAPAESRLCFQFLAGRLVFTFELDPRSD